MTITLINEEIYNKLCEIQEKFPKLTYQNKGYDTPDFSNLTKEEKSAFDYCTEVIGKSVKGFSEFNHFKLSNKGEVKIRFQYNWTADSDRDELHFTGVGYLYLDELYKGFREK